MKKETKEKINNFFQKIDKICNSVFIPFLCIVLLMLINEFCKETGFGIVFSKLLIGLFIAWLIFVVYACVRSVVNIKTIWPLVVSITLVLLSIIASLGNEHQTSDICFIIAGMFFELSAIHIIIHNIISEGVKVSTILITSILFIVVGYSLIYFSCYGNETIFNSLVTLFSSIIGGSLTLGGVAWTIKHQKEEKRKEELLKLKPYFSFNVLSKQPKNLENVKVCFPEELEVQYSLSVCGEIENSNSSIMILNRIYHDHKWFNLECNNTLIQSGKLIINFKFEDPNDVFLEVSDVIGTKYYYKLDLLHVALLGGKEFGLHTIRGVKEIDGNIIQKVEK